jgi:hypothetical protein
MSRAGRARNDRADAPSHDGFATAGNRALTGPQRRCRTDADSQAPWALVISLTGENEGSGA